MPTAPPRHPGGSVVELVGPAGAGKTTLLGALSRRNPDVVPTPVASRPELFPHYAQHAALLLRAGLLRPRSALAYRTREARAMTYVRAWREPAKQLAAEQGRHVLMDHGPVFRLAFLREFGSPIHRSPAFRRWWDRSLALWAESLDVLFWLDAPDAVLLERVRERNLAHAIKRKSDIDARSFLARYRRGFEAVIGRVRAGSGPVVIRFDTAREPLDAMVERALAALAERARAA